MPKTIIRRVKSKKNNGKGRSRTKAAPDTNHRPGTISALQPWVAEGTSRRSWYRRRAAEGAK